MNSRDLEDLVMMDEVRNLSLSVDGFAAILNRLCHGARSTGEHPDLAHVAVLLLDKLQERRHVRTSEVVYGFEPGEHASATQALEMVLADIQHCGSQVKLVEELSDENMHLQHISHILLLYVT